MNATEDQKHSGSFSFAKELPSALKILEQSATESQTHSSATHQQVSLTRAPTPSLAPP